MQESLADLINLLGLDFVNSKITESNFPILLEDEDTTEKEYKLFHFKNPSSDAAIKRKMSKENFRCPTKREFLRWAVKNWNKESTIIALDQCWLACGPTSKLVLDLFGVDGEYDLYWFSSDEGFYFLGVRK